MAGPGGFAALRARLAAARARDPGLYRVRWGLGIALAITAFVVLTGNPMEGVPERVAEGKTLRGIDYWRTYGWAVALGNSVLLAVLLATSRRWFVRDEHVQVPALQAPRTGRVFAVVLLAAVVAGGFLSVQRLGQSFWDDEEYNMNRSIDGEYVVGRDGALDFREAKWRDAFWYYYIPNNHVPHTLLARISLGAWRLVAQPESRVASEPAVRTPAFIAGLLSIASVGLLLRQLGFPAAGLLAAWLLAMHPWHFRYASEARGYSLMLFLLTASLTLLLRALEQGSWRRWAAFGAAQFLLLWTYVGLGLHLVVVNLVALGSIVWLHRGTPHLAPQIVRWTAANLFGAMLWLQLMVPNLGQVPAYMARGGRDLGERWLTSAMSHLYAGMPWSHGPFGRSPVYPELVDAAAASPTLVWGLLAVMLGLLAIGAVRLLARGGVHAGFVAIFLLPGPLTYVLGVVQEANLYVWYLVFMLPSLAALVALGLATLVSPRWAGGAITAGAGVALVVAHLGVTSTARTALLERSFKPARESVRLTRANPDPEAPENRQVVTGHYRDFTQLYYDPAMLGVESPEALLELMRQADADGRALYMNFGRRRRLGKRQPELLELIENSGRFEKIAELPGFEPPWTRHVWRYLGSPQARIPKRLPDS